MPLCYVHVAKGTCMVYEPQYWLISVNFSEANVHLEINQFHCDYTCMFQIDVRCKCRLAWPLVNNFFYFRFVSCFLP